MNLELDLDHNFIKSLGLNDRQLEAALYFDSPLLIIAGAGTGKTKTLISKLAILVKGGINPSQILAITFTNKAADEMKERVWRLIPQASGLWCMTFHSFGARFLRMHYKEAGLSKDFSIYDEDDQKKLLSLVIKDLGFSDDQNKRSVYLSIISRAKDELMDCESYLLNARIYGNTERIKAAQIYFEYQKRLRESNAVDFGDLLLKPVEVLKSNPDLLNYYQEYFKYILIDEYQDTNKAQYYLVKILSEKIKNICVVGDPDQSIYGWRGADIRNILQFGSDFKDAKTIVLEQNYRSTSRILNAANKVIKHNKKRNEKNLWTLNGEGEDIELIEAVNEIDEAEKIARIIKNNYQNKDYRIAIFYRTNAQSRNFEESFRRYKIPYQLIGTVRFYERKEIKDALAYLRVIVNPYDRVNMMRIINTPSRGIGEKTIDRIGEYADGRGISFFEALLLVDDMDLSDGIKKSIKSFVALLEEFRGQLKTTQPHIFLENVLIRSGYWQMIEDEADNDKEMAFMRLANLQELVNAIKQFEEDAKQNNEPPTIQRYLEEVSLQNDLDNLKEDSSQLTLMTLHLAKGLEFDVVFITGLEEGLFPINSRISEDDDMEEERRLCYVGMTRAKKKLYLSWAQTRRIFGKTYPNMMSRFILESGIKTYSKSKNPDDIKVLEARTITPQSPGIGKKVVHPVFGYGTVLDIIGSGEFAKIKIRFNDGSVHTFMLKFAPIEIL